MNAVTSSSGNLADTNETDGEPEPWPPPEWRESSRGLGRKEAVAVFGAIFGIIGVLVLISIWAAHVG